MALLTTRHPQTGGGCGALPSNHLQALDRRLSGIASDQPAAETDASDAGQYR